MNRLAETASIALKLRYTTMLPTPETIQRAAEILRQIEALQSELTGLFGANANPSAPKRRGRPPGSGKRRKMSDEGKAKIAAAAKARWARFRAQKAGK